MHRRVFLKSLGTLSVAGFAAAVLPAMQPTEANSQRFKVVGGGQLAISNDGGRTWQPSIRLRPDVTVTGIFRKGQNTRLALSFRGHAFALESADLVKWHTLR